MVTNVSINDSDNDNRKPKIYILKMTILYEIYR